MHFAGKQLPVLGGEGFIDSKLAIQTAMESARGTRLYCREHCRP